MYIYTSLRLIAVEFVVLQQICHAAIFLPEDAKLNTTGLATKYGHPPVPYEIVTEDGYILTIYRLPGKDKIPILLTHGLEDSSDAWLLRGNNSLAITLANAGCDVWLSNSRGNRYSRRHKYLDPDKDDEFWRFSFHEMGYYDLPPIINTILNETGAPNLTAIGHSQGNTMFYVLGSERSEYNTKINVLIALAPIAYLQNNPIPISTAVKFSPIIAKLAKKLGIYELSGDSDTSTKLRHNFCATPIIGYKACVEGEIFIIMGRDPDELEPEFYRIAALHFPAGTSALCTLHLLQLGYRKSFARYDYGREVNQRIYNSTTPPVYSLDRVTMPIALFTAKNDPLSTIPDVEILRNQLPNVVYYIENPRSLFNHIDYLWGRNMQVYLFPYIYEVLNTHNHNID